MDGLVPTLDCCKTLDVSTERSVSVVPYTPPSKSAPPHSVSTTAACDEFAQVNDGVECSSVGECFRASACGELV